MNQYDPHSEFVLQEDHLVVPPRTGIEGFILFFRRVLQMKLVQHISIDLDGKVTVQRLVKQANAMEEGPMQVDFAPLELPAIIQRAEAVAIPQPLPIIIEQIIPHLLSAVQSRHLYPVLFVVHDLVFFQRWLKEHIGCDFAGGCFGFGLAEDHDVPADSIYLLAGPQPTNVPSTATHKFRAVFPFQEEQPEDEEMEIIDVLPS